MRRPPLHILKQNIHIGYSRPVCLLYLEDARVWNQGTGSGLGLASATVTRLYARAHSVDVDSF